METKKTCVGKAEAKERETEIGGVSSKELNIKGAATIFMFPKRCSFILLLKAGYKQGKVLEGR
jgi:hypothetical protein